MKTYELPCIGPQHVRIPKELRDAYCELFTSVRDNYPDAKLSRFFPLQGEYYDDATQLSRTTPFDNLDFANVKENEKYLEPAVKLMVVGRSVNGWTNLSESSAKNFSMAATLELMSDKGFSWLRNDGQGKDTYIREDDGMECRYNINKSAFFRAIRNILRELKPVSRYQDRWFENIVWNNLYPIAPTSSGNAEGKLQNVQLEICKKLLVQQIDFYKPTHILFITDWDYWFERFSDIFPNVTKTGNTQTDNVVGYGKHQNSKVVVSIRPDRTKPNKPNEELFAQDIVAYFDKI